MESNAPDGRVTKSAVGTAAQSGDIDKAGDLVGSLVERIGTARDPGAYLERPGLDDRIEEAGQNIAAVRRMLGVRP